MGLPIIIYNVVPIVPIPPDLLARLAEIPEVVGIKQSIDDGTPSPGGHAEAVTAILRSVGDRVAVLASYDALIMPGLMLGACGTICAINTILPRLSVELYDAV